MDIVQAHVSNSNHTLIVVIYCTVQHGSQAYLYSYTLSWINTCTIQTIHNLHCKFCRMLGISTYTVKSIHNSTLWKLICIHWNTGFLNNTSIRFFFLHISCSRIINNFSSHIAKKFRHYRNNSWDLYWMALAKIFTVKSFVGIGEYHCMYSNYLYLNVFFKFVLITFQ